METADPHPLQQFAQRIRLQTLHMICRAGSSHIGSAFSMAELLAVLYGKVLRIDPANPVWPGRDRFILSKGHACAALYVALAECGFFPAGWLEDFYRNGGPLPGHATSSVPGVEVSTGSLGHGLAIACGMALAAKYSGETHRVFALLSDGECDEGSTWEAALFAAHHQLENLTVIVDYNKIQSLGSVQEVLNLDPLAEKWRAFGWAALELDGHDVEQIAAALGRIPLQAPRPTCVVAHTVKGKGVSFMENQLLWHYRTPDRQEMDRAFSELARRP